MDNKNVGEIDDYLAHLHSIVYHNQKSHNILSYILLFYLSYCVIFILDEPHKCVLINDKVLIPLSLYLLLFHTK